VHSNTREEKKSVTENSNHSLEVLSHKICKRAISHWTWKIDQWISVPAMRKVFNPWVVHHLYLEIKGRKWTSTKHTSKTAKQSYKSHPFEFQKNGVSISISCRQIWFPFCVLVPSTRKIQLDINIQMKWTVSIL